jgi:hypothetical protein
MRLAGSRGTPPLGEGTIANRRFFFIGRRAQKTRGSPPGSSRESRRRSIPNAVETRRSQVGIDDRVLDRHGRDSPGSRAGRALVGQRETAGMPEHAGVYQRQTALGAHDRPALAEEQEPAAGLLAAMQLAELAKFVASDRLRRGDRALQRRPVSRAVVKSTAAQVSPQSSLARSPWRKHTSGWRAHRACDSGRASWRRRSGDRPRPGQIFAGSARSGVGGAAGAPTGDRLAILRCKPSNCW